MMSEQLQSIVEAARNLNPDERRQLMAAISELVTSDANRERRVMLESIKGSLRHVPLSSEDFIRRKQFEIDLEDEPGADMVLDTLFDSNADCYAHALNLCEVYYNFHRMGGQAHAEKAIAELTKAGVKADENLSPEVWQRVGILKSEIRRISLADCFALELTGRLNAIFLTSDHHEFDVLVNQTPYAIKFIR